MKPTLFIGSSGRARPIVDQIILRLSSSGLAVLPWWRAFPASEFTLEALIKAADKSDFAAFVFAADDELVTPEQTQPITRDNVLFEYGLFCAKLGRQRTLIFEQNGVKMPSDLLAVTTIRFSDDENTRDAEISTGLRNVLKEWESIGPKRLGDSSLDSSLGLRQTLIDEKARLEATTAALSSQEENAPIDLDSLKSCRSAYLEALSLVTGRFWTTTFLSSGFWSAPRETAAISRANSQLSRRLLAAQKQPPRRIFLLDRPVDEYIAEEAAYRKHLRSSGNIEKLKRHEDAFLTVSDNIQRLKQDGCELRVGYDEKHYKVFKRKIPFSYHDSELAIYDDFRIDVFGGGSTSVINRVRCYLPHVSGFAEYLDAATSFFQKLWGTGVAMDTFMDRLSAEIEAHGDRIEYEPNWLARYEYALNDQDSRLKTTELDHALVAIKHHFSDLRISRCLDIGTCTGRYPLRLADELPDCSSILGIDADIDCIDFARAKCAYSPKISITHEDFTRTLSSSIDGEFELVTCMLGTLSHFGRDRREDQEDSLQRCLERMSGLLSDQGLLVIGVWSERACNKHELLSIYSEHDSLLLSKWTPPAAELSSRLERTGLYGRRWDIDPRLDLWLCTKQRSNSSLPPRPPALTRTA